MTTSFDSYLESTDCQGSFISLSLAFSPSLPGFEHKYAHYGYSSYFLTAFLLLVSPSSHFTFHRATRACSEIHRTPMFPISQPNSQSSSKCGRTSSCWSQLHDTVPMHPLLQLHFLLPRNILYFPTAQGLAKVGPPAYNVVPFFLLVQINYFTHSKIQPKCHLLYDSFPYCCPL